jgi:hypothetical protein
LAFTETLPAKVHTSRTVKTCTSRIASDDKRPLVEQY